MRKLISHFSTCLSILILLAPSGLAQSTGTVHGRVQDRTGAVVPETSVVITQQGTNYTRTLATDGGGLYVAPSLPVGDYQVRFIKPGFNDFLQKGVTLSVNTDVEVDGTLEVAQASAKVTVSADANLVQTTSTALVQVVDRRRIEDLPLNGRNVLQLVTLNAGVSDRNATGPTIQSNTLAKGRYQVPASINGARGNGTNYLLDGTENNDNYTNISAPFPNPDAIEEFSIQTSSFDAQYGRGVGGVVNMVTKSGTNDIHGSVFEYLRNNDLNAANFFTGRDSLKRNQFGFSLGGPLVVPHVYNGKNRTFLFGSYQGTRESVATPGVSRTAPSEAMKRGDLSSFLAPNGTGRIKDPATNGQYFPGNQIPVSRFDPVAANMINYIPSSTQPGYIVRFGTPSNLTQEDQYVFRGDQIISSKQQLTFRYFLLRYNNPWSYIPNNLLYTVNGQYGDAHNAAVTHTYSISPTLLNQFTVAFSRQTPQSATPQALDSVNFQAFGSRINLAPSPTMDLSITGWSGATLGLGFYSAGTNYSIGDTFSISTGRNNLRFGGDIRRSRMDKNSNFNSGGNATFSGLLSSDAGKSNAGNAFADFLLGQADTFQQQSMWSERIQSQFPELFIQDDLRITPRLTANFGLRWDPRFDIRENEFNKKMTFLPWDPTYRSQRFPNAPGGLAFLGDPGFSNYITKPNWLNFAPRIGLAYQLQQKMVIRAAYGIFYDQQMMINNNRSAQGAPFIQQVVLRSTSLSNPYGAGVPIIVTPEYPDKSFVFAPGVTWSLPATTIPTGYVQQWNFILERQLSGDSLLRVGYVGSKGTHLLSNSDVNPAFYSPGATASNVNARRPFQPLGSITLTEAGGRSHYNSLQATFQRRYSHGFSVLANYTWSKSIDNSSACQGDGPCMGPNPFNWNDNIGPSDFDITHRFVASGFLEHPKLEHWNPILRTALGGWQSNFIFSAQTGTPLNIVSGVNNSLNGVGGDFADLTGASWKIDHSSKAAEIGEYFNTAAFKVNTVGTIGNGRRNQLRGPGAWNINYSLFKNFRLTERFNLQFRGEFFNVLNHANLQAPNTTVTSPTFGQITSADDPRIIQFGLRLVF